MQREQDYNTEDRNNLDTGRTADRDNELRSSLADDNEGILDAPVSRVDGETPFGNVSDTYIAPGGEDGDEDYDDEEEDDDFDDDDDDVESAVADTDDVTETDPDAEDLTDDDLLLDDDDEDDEDDDDSL